MYGLRKLYRIGYGPSSSHTIGIGIAADIFRKLFPEATSFQATLYQSLALTGIGHGTDDVVKKSLTSNTAPSIVFDKITPVPHPNTIDFVALKHGEQIGKARFFSIGGGDIEPDWDNSSPQILAYFKAKDRAVGSNYKLLTFDKIKAYCTKNKIRLYDYVYRYDAPDIKEYLSGIWVQMKETIKTGLAATGTLPGGLKLQRQAKIVFSASPQTEDTIVGAYAYATAEENAGNGLMVTAPTCGACGVLPSVLLYLQQQHGFSDDQIVNALATAGLIGNVIKTNASVSGAECGCQAEIGSACCMTAGAVAQLFDQPIPVIEAAAAIAMEHNLGLTCDPIRGLVQVPCIERNPVAAIKALNAYRLAKAIKLPRPVSLDQVIDTMYRTGLAMHADYKETSIGGLAALKI